MTPKLNTQMTALARQAAPNLLRAMAMGLMTLGSAWGAVTATQNGAALATRRYSSASTAQGPVTITLAAEAGFTITATLDDAPLAAGTTVVRSPGYHEVVETKTPTAGGAATTSTFQFIIPAAGRGSSEMGLPPHLPLAAVDDAPSAFATGVLQLSAPSRYPLGLPVPISARLVKGATAGAGAGDPLWLHGTVRSEQFPLRSIRLRRGWGSTILPAATAAGTVTYDGQVSMLADPKPIVFESTTTWIDKAGTLSSSEIWPADSRISLTATLTVAAGATLTIEAGTVVKAAPGAEIWVQPGASVVISGTASSPVCMVPVNTANPWGGFWLWPSANGLNATLTAQHGLFCCWGANPAWYTSTFSGAPSRTGFGRHRQEQPFCAIAPGATCSLSDCALIGPITLGERRAAGFSTDSGTLELNRVLLQRAITGGEQERGSVEIHSSALIEFTEANIDIETGGFYDGDNDGIYLFTASAASTYHLSKTLIGWTKDDGIDCGESGGGRVECRNCWFESCLHEGFSNSGTGRIPESKDGVHINCGQGMECGYGDSAGNGPNSLIERCLMVGNFVGARYGDNYDWDYGGGFTLRDSFLLYNSFRDGWAIEWDSWNYRDNRFISQRTMYSRATDLARQNGAEDSDNTLWNPDTDGPQIASFMPVPNAHVGVAILATKKQDALANFPTNGQFTVRLSTFSSLPVTVPWSQLGRTSWNASTATTIASGALTFAPGETIKTITAPLASGSTWGLVEIALGSPTNAEVTGENVYFVNQPPAPADQILVTQRSAGWNYSAIRRAPTGAWTTLAYIEPAAEWVVDKPAPIGFGDIGTGTLLVKATTLNATEAGSTVDRTRTVYFRKTFSVTDPTAIRGLRLRLMRDDGVVAYINGVEVVRDNIDAGSTVGGTITYNTAAAATPPNAEEDDYFAFTAPPQGLSTLVSGTNVLAIEIHQARDGSGNWTSSDLVMDAELTATFEAPRGSAFGLIETAGRPVLFWDDSALILQESDNLNAWLPCPATSPFVIPLLHSRKFYRLSGSSN